MPKGPPPKVDWSGKGLAEFTQKEIDKEKNVDKVQTLFLYKNKLTTLNPSLSAYANLRVLYIDHNNFTELPAPVCNLVTLEKLHAENNKLVKIPPGIGNLQNLKKLYLFDNCLEDLPIEMANLRSLEVLDLHNNKLTVLPPHLAANERLRELAIFGNQIISPPPFIVNNGMVHMMTYMKEIRDSLLSDAPDDQFMFERKVDFLNEEKKATIQKRATVAKTMVKDEGIKQMIEQASKAEKSFLKENSKRGSKESLVANSFEDIKMLSKNHLLYFLSECAAYEEQGRRDYMEDRCVVIPRMRQKKPARLMDEVVNLFSKVGYFGVYDGHGGAKCAEYMTTIMHKNIVNSPEFQKGEFEKAIRAGFRKTDTDFLNLCKQYRLLDGSTAVVAIIIDNKLITAHAGDSRAVLCRDKKAIRLTEDHKPERADELARVEELGGEIVFRGNCFRIMGDLAMSRSFGDLRLKEPVPLVISDPEITIEELTPKDEFIILASDGLWDVLSDQKAVDIVKKCETVEEASRKLVQTAIELGTMDNTTAIVVRFNWSLDFLTDAEITGNVGATKQSGKAAATEKKARIDQLIDNEKLERARSDSLSFRDNLEGLAAANASSPASGLFQKVTGDGVMLKVIIPAISATKLVKFELSTRIKDIMLVMIKKHRFTDASNNFEMYLKDVLLDSNSDIKSLKLKDNDILEMRKKAGTSAELHVATESPNEKFAEALPPPTLQQDKPIESSRDEAVFTSEGVAYQLTESDWKVIEEKPSKVIVYEGSDKGRVAVVSATNQPLINAWIRTEYPFNPPKENFTSFFAVVSGQLKQYAIKFTTNEEAEKFAGHFNACINKLKAKIKADKLKEVDQVQRDIDNEERSITTEEQEIAALEAKLQAKQQKLQTDQAKFDAQQKKRASTTSAGAQSQQAQQPRAAGLSSPPPLAKSPSVIWKEAKAPDGRIYYYNTQTKATSWTKPAEMN